MSEPDVLLLEDIKTRIEAIRDAIKRSRLAFLILNIASASVLLAAWNAYFSWYRSFALSSAFADNPVTNEAQKELLRGWVESHGISISLLGIRIGVSDLAYVGSIALFVGAAWFFYSARKENHLIGVLLRDTQCTQAELRRLVYHGVSGYMLFITMTLDDTPIRNLAGGGQQKAILFLRPAMRVLHFLPALVIAFMVAIDLFTMWWLPAAFRFPHDPLRGRLLYPDRIQFWVMEATAFGFFLLTYFLSKRSAEFAEATRSILIEYGNLPRAEAVPKQVEQGTSADLDSRASWRE
jgi:hypothetical protein